MRRTLDAYFSGVNEDRFDDVAALFAPDATLTAPGVGPLKRDEIAAYLAKALSGYPSHHDEPTRTLLAERAATVEITFTGETTNGTPDHLRRPRRLRLRRARPDHPPAHLVRLARAAQEAAGVTRVRRAAGVRRPLGLRVRRRARAAPGARPGPDGHAALPRGRDHLRRCCSRSTRRGGRSSRAASGGSSSLAGVLAVPVCQLAIVEGQRYLSPPIASLIVTFSPAIAAVLVARTERALAAGRSPASRSRSAASR